MACIVGWQLDGTEGKGNERDAGRKQYHHEAWAMSPTCNKHITAYENDEVSLTPEGQYS